MMHTSWEWWKDIIIPAMGAIGIPLLVWGLTWYYGAGRAEKQKELRVLRDNLNLLLSFCIDSIDKIITFRKTLLQVYEVEKNNTIDPFAEATRDLTKTYISPIDTGIINIASYSPCIAYSENYVVKLCNMVSALKIKDFQIETCNCYVNAIRNKGDLKEKVKCLQELVEFDRCEHENFLRTAEGTILFIRDFIQDTLQLEKRIKNLKLDTITYSQEQLALFAELEKKWIEEPKNDH